MAHSDDIFLLLRERIDTEALVARLKAPEDGAVVVFDGIVRNNTHRVGIVHRLGRLEIGETSVVIVITSAHRAAAFDACRYAIDTLKRVVPIWKKEYFAGGAVWAEGEKSWQEAISRPKESIS